MKQAKKTSASSRPEVTAKSPKPTSESEAKIAEPVVILKKQPRILDPTEITARQSSIEKGKEFVRKYLSERLFRRHPVLWSWSKHYNPLLIFDFF